MITAGFLNGIIKILSLTPSGGWGDMQSQSPLMVDAGTFGVQCVTFNSTGNTIVAGCSNGNIFCIDTATRQVQEPPLTKHSDRVTGMAFSADGHLIISGSLDKTIRLWDARPGGTVVSVVLVAADGAL